LRILMKVDTDWCHGGRLLLPAERDYTGFIECPP